MQNLAHSASLIRTTMMNHQARIKHPVEYAAAHIQHMQKALMEMNLQRHRVVSDITSATGMRIRAIVAGERNPDVLPTYRDLRCHSSIETIRAELVGNDRDEHVFALTQSLELYHTHQARCSTATASWNPWWRS
ncbi:hypothetical protein NKJ73_31710 [Mesorhizobium sp. M0074]|uniref:hypothetical protein n=1 Tax=Mesorhizobium sp. M0074 TaxID=2956869 RepID=UPI003335FC71